MISKDYIMRMVEQFTNALSKILFEKDKKNYKEARFEISNSFQNILGLDYELVSIVPTEDLMKFLKFDDRISNDKCLIAAELYRLDAEIFELQNEFESSIKNYKYSLFLFLEAYLNQVRKNTDEIDSKIELIIMKLNQFEISNDLKKRMAKYYELTQSNSKAEDIIFDLAKSHADNFIQYSREFYSRLMLKDDEELKVGNLPKEEILEGLQELDDLDHKLSEA